MASGGLSMPVMDYALAEPTQASGYANPGYQIRVGMGFEISRSFGLKLMYLYNENPFNDAKYTEDFQAVLPYVFPGTTLQKITTNPWQLNGMMLGIFYPMRTPNTTYEFKLMAGLLSSVMPQQDYSLIIQSSNRPLLLRINEVTSNNAAYQVGLDVRTRLYRNLLLHVNLDFLYTEQTFNGITISDPSSGLAFLWSQEYTQYYHVVGFGLGLAYQLDTY